MVEALHEIEDLIKALKRAIADDSGDYPLCTGIKLQVAIDILECARQKLGTQKFECKKSQKGFCKGAEAWTGWIFDDTIHLCPKFFVHAPVPYGPSQPATLVHEASHNCGTIDGPRDYPPKDSLLCGYEWNAYTYTWWVRSGFCVPGANK